MLDEIFCFNKREKNRKPIATITKREPKAVKGEALSTITLLVIKADDQSKIKVNDKIFVITENYFIEFT